MLFKQRFPDCDIMVILLMRQKFSHAPVYIFTKLVLIMFLFPQLLKGQEYIQGRVVNARNEPIPFTQLAILKLPDSTLAKVEITDSAGYFKIHKPKYLTLLRITAFGYESKSVVVPDSANNNQALQIVMKPKDHELEALSIIAKTPLLERKADRIVFNVSASISSVGADAFDLLKKAPGIRVGENEGISIAGKSTVSIMLDGRIQQLGTTELVALLRSIPAENIDKIEIITTPPGWYDAQGNSGIINIITKRSGKQGLSGSIGIGYQQRVRGSERFTQSLNYRNGRVNVYFSGNTNNYDFQSIQQTIVSYSTQTQSQTLNQRNRPLYNRYQVGMDISLSNNSVIGALYSIGTTNRKTTQAYRAPVISAGDGAIDSTLHTDATEHEKATRHVANLNYEWKIDTAGKKINIDADYFTRTENDIRDFNARSYFENGTHIGPTRYSKTTAKQDIGIRSVKADLFLPYNSIELSLGAKISLIHTLSDNRFSALQGYHYESDSLRSDKFDYKENTQAIYASALRKSGKWEMQLGIRVENTQTTGTSIALAQTVINNYFQLFPSAYVQYQLNDKNVFNINYSRRVGRPSYEELNPFRVYGTGNSYTAGNPFLRPSFYHTVELGYSLNSKYILTAYAGVVNNIHARISQIDTPNKTFYITNDNAGTSINTGISVTAMLNPVRWMENSLQLQYYYDRVNSDYYNTTATRNGVTAFDAQITNSFRLNKDQTLLAEIGYTYSSGFQYDFSIRSPYSVLNAGIKALLLDKQFVLSINASDILRTERYTFENIYNRVIEDSYFDAQCLSISLNWKFGNKKIKPIRQRETDTDEIRRSE